MTVNNQGFPQIGLPFVTQSGNITQPWYQLLISLWNRTGGGQGGGFAPPDGTYLVTSPSPSIPNAEVVTNTTTVEWDFSTPNQAKANVVQSALEIEQSQVASLVTDLNNKVSTDVSVLPGTGLVGGGALTASVTLGVDANGITNALLDKAPAHTLKGNNTGALADVLDLTVSQVLAMFGGVSGTVSLAKLTGGGTNGSLTVVGGIITNITNPT